jgi:hypothetical protein
MREGLFLHFEMIPDRLPEALRGLIARFPAGTLQFEVGIQTFNEEVSARIKRRQNYAKLADNFNFLRSQTGVHIHADLIAGLPGETLASFGAGFDRLVALNPQEIQVGILKRLRGTPIIRHDQEWQMVYSSHPPYEILQNRTMTFGDIQQMRRFARYWDLVANSGNFVETAPLLWGQNGSPFNGFLAFSEWLHVQTGRGYGIALNNLAELIFGYLTANLALAAQPVAESLWRDYQRNGRSDIPPFLRPFLPALESRSSSRRTRSTLPKRQSRHLARLEAPSSPLPPT